MVYIKIPGDDRITGRTRSVQARNLKKEGWGNGGMTEEQLDKCKFLEKKHGIKRGFLNAEHMHRVR